MNDLIEQSRAYADLGMLDEAGSAALEAIRTGCDEEIYQPWLVRLAYMRGSFKSAAALGLGLLARGKADDCTRHYAALAVHHLGKSSVAAEMMLAIEESSRVSVQSYVIACFLAAAGESDEAAKHLLRSLPGQQDTKAKTWLDGDLKILWAKFARGEFNLATAHLLLDWEFDHLRGWQADIGVEWELDFSNLRDLPKDLRAAVRFDPKIDAYVLDYEKAPAGSALAARFEAWAREEVRTNQTHFDTAQRIAWQNVLDAQPRYALAAWERGDLCAVRHHIVWTIMGAPERISAFAHIGEIAPFVDDMQAMLESDKEFFEKLLRAHVLRQNDPDEAMKVVNALPSIWQKHPFIEHIRGLCLDTLGRAKEALACFLHACDCAPDDAAYFIAATGLALRHGWNETAAAIHKAAPAAAHCYKDWLEADALLKGQTYERLAAGLFCGQPDLGGQIIPTEKSDFPIPSKGPTNPHPVQHSHE